MNCETVRRLLPALVIDGADTDELRRAEAHLSACEECRAEAEALSSLWRLVGPVAAPEPSPRARLRLAEAVSSFRAEAESATVVRSSRRTRWRTVAQLVASVVVFLGGALTGALVSRDAEEPGATAADTPSFLVLMRGNGATPPVSDSMDVWLAGLREESRLIGGGQITEATGTWLGAPPEPFQMSGVFTLFGYIIIQAQDAEEAREIAGAAPHIGMAGAVEIWPLR